MEEQKFKVIIVEDVKLELKGTEEIFRHEIPNAEVIGTAMTSFVVSIVKSSMHVSTTPAVAYAWVFGVAIVIVLAAAALIMRIRNVK